MTADDRIALWQLDASGASDGQVSLYDAATDEWTAADLPTSGIESLTVVPPLVIDTTDPANPVLSIADPLVTIDENGNPGLVFTNDGGIVYTEGP